ncbi:phage tail protein [Nostoc sp. CHAB 5834]|nr:phage tail protein [Nostoc sp. CHAB 5834]
MAGENQDTNWPLPKFFFIIDLGETTDVPFQEVTGLQTETQVIEYRAGDSKVFSTIKMPGLTKFSNVTLKRGVFAKNNTFFNWYSKIKLNAIKRETVVIKLLDEGGNPTMVWTLHNAWPCKIQGTDLKSDSNEIAVETIEIAFETLTITNN